jgi:hypothetical protein
MSSSGNHPEINSLIRFKDQAREELNTGQYMAAIKTLCTLMRELRTIDQDIELKGYLIKERKALAVYKYPGGVKKHVMENKFKYEAWYEEVVQILWKKNYLVNESYGMYYPSEKGR